VYVGGIADAAMTDAVVRAAFIPFGPIMSVDAVRTMFVVVVQYQDEMKEID
jgi:hypothetical protein